MMKGFGRLLGLALAWMFIYALPSIPIEGLSNLGIQFSFTNAVDMWPQTLGIPGFIGGMIFGGLLAITGRLHGFETMSAGRLSARGTLAGALLGGFVLLLVMPEPAAAAAWIVGIAMVLGMLAGPGSAMVFRLVVRRWARGAERRRTG